MFVYTLAIAMGVVLRIRYPGVNSAVYNTYKDLLPLLIAIPAAYLAFNFQRRALYVQALRSLWGNMVAAVQGARAYTHMKSPSAEDYRRTLSALSIVIDEARGVFENLPVKGKSDGWYPFEPIKEIHDQVRDLGFGPNLLSGQQEKVRTNINVMWKAVRSQLLREFDRDVPTHHHAWYVGLSGAGTGETASPVAGRWSRARHGEAEISEKSGDLDLAPPSHQ